MTVGFIAIAVLLVGLNILSYTQRPETVDDELNPDRSSYNMGPTGTNAMYTLFEETGIDAVRWEKPIAEIGGSEGSKVGTFVFIDAKRRDFTVEEARDLFRWVEDGGHLVVIDRNPPAPLHRIGRDWQISFNRIVHMGDDERNFATRPAAPLQPSESLAGVFKIQLSEYATSISTDFARPSDNGILADEGDSLAETSGGVELLSTGSRCILLEVVYGKGRVSFLADPFIVSNAGIKNLDNARLAVNLVTRRPGAVAIDEYHHGHDSEGGDLLRYFSGTPVVPIALQLLLVLVVFLAAKSVRFGRAIPESVPSRVSKLEYVSAMAALQQRTRAYDVAIENVYHDFTRRLSNLFGADTVADSKRLTAELVAERIGRDATEIEALMLRCEDIIRGGATNERETLRLVREIREIESMLS